jgi:broad specificity phosphatase PhoE
MARWSCSTPCAVGGAPAKLAWNAAAGACPGSIAACADSAALSDAGRLRAQCLANTLADAQIQQIFISDLQRTEQTAAPLAEKLHLKPVSIPLSKPDQLIEAIRSGKAEHVLVVWHDATLPGIMRALGAPEITPIAHTEYDRFFILTLPGSKTNAQSAFVSLRYCDSPK